MGISENESYLDSLLKAVMEPKTVEEPEIIEETDSVTEPEVILASEVTTEYGVNTVSDMFSEIEFIPEEILQEPEIEFIPEEIVEEPEIEFIPEEIVEEPEVEFVPEEMTEEPESEFMDMPDFVMDEDTAKEVQALLDIDFETNSDDVTEGISEEPAIEFVPEEIVEELEEMAEDSEAEFESEEVVDLSDFADFSEVVEQVSINEDLNDDLLDEDIENLLGMESIETDDSELEDLEADFSSDFNNEVEMVIPTVDENQFSASPSLEDTQTMSQEDIESLLNSSAEVSLENLFGGQSTEEPATEDDLLALLSGGTDDVASADDLLALLGGEEESEGLSYIDLENDDAVEEPKEEADKKEKKGKKKRKKDKKTQESDKETEETKLREKTEKKAGAFKRFMDFLMEEDEEEAGTHGEMEMTEDEMSDLLRNVSDENKQIIKDLDKEEKKKKKRKKKDKKEEAEPVDADEDEIEAKPTGKKKKQKKPKKEKKVKLEEYDPTAKKLSKKKVGITLGLIATIMVAILLVNYLYAGAQVLQKARNAYYSQDYAGCYETLYGKELNESDEILFNRSSLMLKMTRSIDAYEGFMAAQMPIQALDSLIQGIGRFEALRVEAALYELEQEAERIYGQLVDCLGEFGLSEQKAMDIYNSESDEEYTNQLIDAVENGAPLVKEEEEVQKEYLYDALPVEEEIN